MSLEKFLSDALCSHFGKGPKCEVVPSKDRLNFACPVCNDSAENARKKRGNIYLETNTYKCYNCGYFSSLKKFLYLLKEMGDIYGEIPEDYLKDSTYDKMTQSLGLSNIGFISTELEDAILKYGLDRQQFKDLYQAVEVLGTPMEKYLKFRSISKFSNFLYVPYSKQLIVLNRDDQSEKILSFQFRNFSGDIKYLTYKLSTMYKHCKIPIPENDATFNKLDDLSMFFNLLNVNLGRPITYFEGPIDAYFFPNSLSQSSLYTTPPFDLPGNRYFYDCDKSGLKKSRELLTQRKFVFLWSKLLKKLNIEYNREFGKFDFNDLITYTKSKNIEVNFENYFSNDPMDMIWL